MTRFDRQVEDAVLAVTRPHEETIPIERLLDRLATLMPFTKRSKVESSVRRLFHLTEPGTAIYRTPPPLRDEFKFVLIDSVGFEIPADDPRVWIRITPGADPQTFAESLLNRSAVSYRPIQAVAGLPTAVNESDRMTIVAPPDVSISRIGNALLYAGQINFTVA